MFSSKLPFSPSNRLVTGKTVYSVFLATASLAIPGCAQGAVVA